MSVFQFFIPQKLFVYHSDFREMKKKNVLHGRVPGNIHTKFHNNPAIYDKWGKCVEGRFPLPGCDI